MKRILATCALLALVCVTQAWADSSTSIAPDVTQRTVNWLLYNEIWTRTWDSLATIHAGPTTAPTSGDSLDYRLYLAGRTDTTWTNFTSHTSSGAATDSFKIKFGGKCDVLDFVSTQQETLRLWTESIAAGDTAKIRMVVDAGTPFHFEDAKIDSACGVNKSGVTALPRWLARGHKNR